MSAGWQARVSIRFQVFSFLTDNKYQTAKACPPAGREKAVINQMVLSTEIEWIGYETKKHMLQVEFIAGGIYQYENVPESVYQSFLDASSHGQFFESQIKGRYSYRKVR